MLQTKAQNNRAAFLCQGSILLLQFTTAMSAQVSVAALGTARTGGREVAEVEDMEQGCNKQGFFLSNLHGGNAKHVRAGRRLREEKQRQENEPVGHRVSLLTQIWVS